MCDNSSKIELLDNFKSQNFQHKNEKNRNEQHKSSYFNRLHINKEAIVDKKQKIQNCENLTFFRENETKKHNF